jgi:MFS family permease
MSDASSATAAQSSPQDPPWPNPRYAWFVAIVMFVCAIFSFLDRQILSLLVEEIKRDLGLSELQMGLLQGAPFAIFYATASIPIALAADRLNRKNIIAMGISLWSLATAACGMAGSFITMFLARIGVGVGEATLSPSAVSMISDYFPKEKLAMALSVFTMGNLMGVGVAVMIGGSVVGWLAGFETVSLPLLGDFYPWQMTFFIVGLPGLLLAVLVVTLREPIRRGIANPDAHKEKIKESLGNFWQFVKDHAVTFATLVGSFTLLVLIAYANFAWMPTFFRRTFDMSPTDVAWLYGPIVAIFGTTGALFGGWFSNYLSSKGYKDAPYRATLLCTIPLAPCAFMTFMVADTSTEAALWFIPWQFFGSVPAGLAGTAMMTITPNEMRAKINSVYQFFSNIIGITLGAASVAFITQEIFADDFMVGTSLAIVNCIGAPLAILVIAPGMKMFRKSRAEIESQTTA